MSKRVDGFGVAQDDVAAFRKDGVVVLRRVFDDWVDPLRRGVERLLADPSPLERSVRPTDGSAPFFQVLCNWQRIPAFADFVMNSDAAPLATALMASRSGCPCCHRTRATTP